MYEILRARYSFEHPTSEAEAAAYLMFDLMQDDPSTFKAGYRYDSALLAALEVFPAADRDELERVVLSLSNDAAELAAGTQ